MLHTDELLWWVGVSPNSISADDTFLTHKTSRREAYDRAEEIPGGEPARLHRVTSLRARLRILFIKWMVSFSPPLADGLLPGVLRDELLDKGVIIERTLPVVDLKSVEAFWLINSLRGWRKAILAENKV